MAAVLLVAGCNYGFQGGGGFPSHLRTLYIESFENHTAQFELEQQLFTRLLDRVPRALGVRPAGREVADVVLRGRILRYDDVAQSYRLGEAGQAAQVLEHQVQIAVAVELIDPKANLVLWESQSLTGRGVYRPDSQPDLKARTEAIEHLVQQILDGAQSQW
ncbi:MAG: hypothetical protein HY561_08040 [Gemmatimonadetes bacterium]|nr:hypothetical protein [Gemmatimonadota bacterium]